MCSAFLYERDLLELSTRSAGEPSNSHIYILLRFTTAYFTRGRSGKITRRSHRDIQRFTSHDQALSQAETRDRRCQTQSHSRTPSEERSGLASRASTSTRRLSRCNACRALPVLGEQPGCQGQHSLDEPCDPTTGLDLEEKDVTRERTKGSRSCSLARTDPNPRCEQADLY